MAIKPILFNTEMVRAILDERKSCTRRIVKPQPTNEIQYPLGICTDGNKSEIGKFAFGSHEGGGKIIFCKPPYQPGDTIYIRETWCEYGDLNDSDQIIDGTEKYYYKADGENPTPYNDFLVHRNGYDEHRNFPVWHPSIHMPKEAARIWLKVTDVRVERLQEITVKSALAEGADKYIHLNGKPDERAIITSFIGVWNRTIKKSDLDRYGWNASPWVWVIEFERCEKPEGV